MNPQRTDCSSSVAPTSANRAGARLSRPPLSTTRSAGMAPSRVITPVTRGGPSSWQSAASPVTWHPARSSIAGSRTAARRNAASSTGRRHMIVTSSASAAVRSLPGMSRASSTSGAPEAKMSASTSGRCSASSDRNPGRKAWPSRDCGMPGRGQSDQTASFPSGTGAGSRSQTITWWPSRPSSSAADSPPIPAPTITISATRRPADQGSSTRALPLVE